LRKNTEEIFFEPNREGAMKSTLLASVSIAALFIVNGANAADLAVKARPMVAAAPVYSWTGCYVGVHAGWGWGRNHANQTGTSFSNSVGAFSSSSRIDTSGALFGGQVGCNYQFSGNWVAGIQFDAAGTDINGHGHDQWDPTDKRDEFGVKSDWLASVTGRVGYTIYDNQGMLYVKGGGAWVHNKWDLSQTDLTWSSFFPSETKAGWTVGVGAEWKFTQNWSGFVEYNYYTFGGNKVLATGVNDPLAVLTSGKQDLSTVKVGVNYSFTQGPLVARY
jgi:outer membrane immunogenic protein